MNKVFLIGRLTKNINLRYTKTNIACATFDLAINNGKEKPADFIKCVIWEKPAENMSKYTHQGSLVAIDGSIKNEKWQDEKGNNRYRTYVLINRITFLDSKKSELPLPQEPDYILKRNNNFKDENEFETMTQSIEIDDNDLPF